MTTMLIDVGNTRVKWVKWDGAAFFGSRAAMRGESSAAALRVLAGDLTPEVRRITVANVAGAEVAQALRALARANGAVTIDFITSEHEACGVRNAYDEPWRLGVDRWAALIGGFRRTQANAPGAATCVIGAGTAVTFDVVRASGEHLGGMIMPSADLSARVLAQRTNDIGEVDVHMPRPGDGLALLGRDTRAAVVYGAWLAVGAGIDRALQAVRDSVGSTCSVYLTGGGAHSLRQWLDVEAEIQENLVFEGMLALSGMGEGR